jgi:hypothetical protein
MPQYIKRLLLTFAVVISLFLVMRFLLVPKSFGEYGHYRGLSLAENADYPLRYAGSAACGKCHQDIIDEKNAGYHAGLACEGCHGPAYAHAMSADSARSAPLPDSLKLERNTSRGYCATCHELNPARLKIVSDTTDLSMVKMIEEKKHGQVINKETNLPYACVECHNPHSP